MLANTRKTSASVFFLAVITLFLSESAFCQAANIHSPSQEELKILRAAAVSPEFNSSDGPNLRVCLMGSQDRKCNTGSIADRAFSPVAHPHEPSDLVRPAACAADVVALGRIVGETSALSANEAAVITLYNFRIQILYKAKDQTLIGKNVSVLRRAGTLSVPEGVIRQEDPAVPPLAIGTDYILLLRALAGTGGYVSATDDLDFEAVLSSGTEGRAASLKGRAFSPLDTSWNSHTGGTVAIAFVFPLEHSRSGWQYPRW
jgi:hypothetical protein